MDARGSLATALAAALMLAACGSGEGVDREQSRRPPAPAASTTSTQGRGSVLDDVGRALAAAGYEPSETRFGPRVVASLSIPMRSGGATIVAAYGDPRAFREQLRTTRRLASRSGGRLVVGGVTPNYYWAGKTSGETRIAPVRLREFHRIVAIAEERR